MGVLRADNGALLEISRYELWSHSVLRRPIAISLVAEKCHEHKFSPWSVARQVSDAFSICRFHQAIGMTEVNVFILQDTLNHEQTERDAIISEEGEKSSWSFLHILVERAPQLLLLVGREIERILRDTSSLSLILLKEFLGRHCDEASLRLAGKEFQIVGLGLKGIDVVEIL